jgi:hypothetical protein
MASCASCGAPGVGPDQACPRCGSRPSPELELDVRARAVPRPVERPKKALDDVSFELAVDPKTLVAERAAEARGGVAPASKEAGKEGPLGPARSTFPEKQSASVPPGARAALSAPVVRDGGMVVLGARASLAPPEPTDVHADARVLADFGEAPRSLLLAPLYAWRVLKRQRELKTAHAARKAEAAHAASALEDALVAFAARVRGAAEKQPAYAAALEELRKAEAVLRSRDKVLAAEQDAQKARLAQVDERLAKLEEELTAAHTDERVTAQELSSAQGALAREEAKAKRAEVELRAAQQREADGTSG